ncbi:MAG TPA: peptidoglycan DD-metalloendopeptidase family protein [Bacteroidales bacterium]|nr:peptidoglycan DD-metalloendopeptidase family protein [Bacteroidales bacterium]
MRLLISVHIIMFLFVCPARGQSKAELEEQRRKTLEEISYVDNLLKQTGKEKTESLSQLKIIGNKLNLRESVLRDLKSEIDLLNKRIELNSLALEMMENDLGVLREDYARSVLNSYKTGKSYNEIIYILSARDFNQGYKRLKYLQQIAKYRRNEAEIISEIKDQVEASRRKLENDLRNVSELRGREEQQRSLLKSEQSRRQKMVQSLGNKEKQLQKELEERKRIAKRIESEIEKLIEEERRKAARADISPEESSLGAGFSENKGRLPWPVDKGVITGQFGTHTHPVLKYVTENNPGVEITSYGETPVRAVFNGEVARVFAIQGANMTVMIRHGKYYTVYQNLVNVRVKAGEKVTTGKVLGNVYNEKDEGNSAILKFMIFDETVKLNPELWISKKN